MPRSSSRKPAVLLAAAALVAAMLASLSPAAAQLLRRLAVDAGSAAAEDVLARVARLTAARAMNSLRRTAASAGDAGLRAQCSASVAWLKAQSERLDDRTTQAEALAALLPWLIDYSRRNEITVSEHVPG